MASENIWKFVYSVNSYHVNWSAEQGPLLAKILKKYMGDHRPTCTAVGVEHLAYPGWLVEIAVNAALPG
jgi:enamine deaminase RidA (YjgF/YER057c/UK114 family)